MYEFGYELSVADCVDLAGLHALLFPELTAKEVDCIYWLALGLQVKDIANITKVSDHMVKKRIKSATDKLTAINTVSVKYIYHRRFQSYQQKQVIETNRLLLLLLKQNNANRLP